jgi:hypothetical protein
MVKSFRTDLCSVGSNRFIYPQQRRFSIAACCVIWLLCVFPASRAHGQTESQVVPPAPTPQLGPMTQEQLEMAARFEECRRKLQEERTSGPITALRFGSTAIEIDVDGTRWKAMSFDAKLALVQTISCYAVAGNPRLNARVQVLDHLDQQKLGYYDGAVLKLQ